MTVQLPLFPVDDSTLDLLSAALDPREHGDPGAEMSSVGPLLRMLGEMHGADYHDHDVLRALIAEVRRQRFGLELIGTKCENFTFNSHWTCATVGGKSPYAKYSAERWCNACIARTALNGEDFPERGTSGVEEVEAP